MINTLCDNRRAFVNCTREVLFKDLITAKKQGTIQGGAGGKFRIGVEVVLDAVAEKKFVPEHLLRAVKNWLAGNEALPRQRERLRRGDFLSAGSWFHPCYIGTAVAEL